MAKGLRYVRDARSFRLDYLSVGVGLAPLGFLDAKLNTFTSQIDGSGGAKALGGRIDSLRFPSL